MSSQRAKIESVKSAIASTTTCTSATVATLSELLLDRVAKDEEKDGVGPKSTARGRITTATKAKTTRPASRPASRGTALKDQEAQGTLPAKEKAILATEIINAGLKSISVVQVVDAQPLKAPQSKADVETPARKALRRSNSLPPSPLQPRSLNRGKSTPSQVLRPTSSSATTALHASGQGAIGECCRIALACLRALQATTPPSVELPPLQLENGMSSLIGKLVAAGQDELAVKELRILKKRLDHEISVKERTSPARKTDKEAPATPAGLNELLDFGAALSSGALLNLAIATQLQVLKLMTTSKKPSVITAAIPQLKPTHPSSPTQFLLNSARQSATHAAKAARQLETLSQLLLSLGPSVSSSDDTAALSSKSHISPDAAFQLQTSAFLNRWFWWKLAGHKASVDEQIWEPYSRCLAAYARRNQGKISAGYDSASKSFYSLCDAIYQEGEEPAFTPKSPFYSIYRSLGTLAQQGGNLKKAATWIERLYSCPSQSELQRCATGAKLLSLRLQAGHWDVADALRAVVSVMEAPVKGSSAEWDELTVEVSKARRVVISMLSKKPDNGDDSSALEDESRQLCESMILLCPRFYSRYLGKLPSKDALAERIPFTRRRQNIEKTVTSTIDSVLYIIKTARSGGRAAWNETDAILQDCKQLLEVIDASAPASNTKPEAAGPSQYVRISNQYFSQYLEMRRESTGADDMKYLLPLRRSIEVVRYRPQSERKAAAMTTKLERLSDLLRGSGQLKEAKHYILMLRDELIDNHVLSTVSKAASTMQMGYAWSVNEDTLLLGKTIASLIKVERKKAPKTLRDVSLIEESWSAEEKGAVLENIFATISSLLTDSASMQKDIYRELLSLYEAPSYPVRRLRVIGDFVQSNPDSFKDVSGDASTIIKLYDYEGLVETSEDAGLQSFAPHLLRLLQSRRELLEEHPRIDLIKPYLKDWCTMIEKSREREALESQIDDVAGFLDHLQSLADFLDMKGFATMRVAVLRMTANIDEVLRDDSADDLILDYSFLASQYLDLGYSGKAGLALDRALHCSQEVTPGTSLRRLVFHADYLLRIGNLDKCEDTLLRAYGIASHNHEAMVAKKYDTDRDSFDRILSDASIVMSNLALQRGKPQEALLHAKRSLRIIARAWKKAERQHISKTQPQAPDESVMDQTTEGMADLTMNTTVSSSPSVVTLPNDFIGSSSWGLVKPMFKCFIHLSDVYAHHGMFQDTLYYAEQAHKIAVNIDSMNYVAEALLAMGNAWLKAGTIEKASDYLEKSKGTNSVFRERQASVVLQTHLSKLYNKQGYQKAELSAYTEAESILSSLLDPSNIHQIDSVMDSADAELARSKMEIEKRKKAATILPPKRTITRRKVPTKAGDAAKPAAESTTSTSDHCLPLLSLKGSLLRQKARSYIKWERYDEVAGVLSEAGTCWSSTLDAIDHRLTQAEDLFHQCAVLLPSDPIYTSLQDSTISYPAVIGGKAILSDRLSSLATATPRNTAASRRNASQSKVNTWSELLKLAHDHLVEAYAMASQISSTHLMNHVASFLNTTSVLLSTYHGSKFKPVHPGASTAVHELAKAISIERERDAIFADSNTSISKEDDLVWPEVHILDEHRESASRLSLQQTAFQKDFIDIIPQAWNVVSITLSENRNELILTRMEANHCPFIVRVPLQRGAARDADEELFGFDQGKTEMLDIIDKANASAHGGRKVTGKAGKLQWWAERDELNNELKELLENIEHVWLGGFRGIFSQHPRHSNLLAKFQKSFQNMLDKHLPSRRVASKKAKTTAKVTLDPRILDLFIGLGDALDEELDLTEPLEDLLYFVVDILQFHGERNALDEINFDWMKVDTLDALKSYHQAAQALNSPKDKHTVLILDKSLHCFPWESLPCMKGKAVSRLPSMGCLRQRIMMQRDKMSDNTGPEGTYISRKSGSYILNPGQDLSTTQSTFEPQLQSLPDWNSIVNREPAETEIKDILERDDLYLYFGHGSGAQYIRSKTIKKLPKCATTFLMGCSSASLTDVGEFSVYGPAMSYVIAGAPAVVGTLWDVTDKDIDRFAKKAFEEWGLYGSEKARSVTPEIVVPKTPGRRRKVKVVEEEGSIEMQDLGGKKSLLQAVAEGRKACNYEYLTAAAVVVYGVPVYFE